MADLIWLRCCYEKSIKLVVVPMKYIFSHAKKDLITGNDDGMKDSTEKRKVSAKKRRSGEVLMNLFIYKKNLTCEKIVKINRCQS